RSELADHLRVGDARSTRRGHDARTSDVPLARDLSRAVGIEAVLEVGFCDDGHLLVLREVSADVVLGLVADVPVAPKLNRLRILDVERREALVDLRPEPRPRRDLVAELERTLRAPHRLAVE